MTVKEITLLYSDESTIGKGKEWDPIRNVCKFYTKDWKLLAQVIARPEEWDERHDMFDTELLRHLWK